MHLCLLRAATERFISPLAEGFEEVAFRWFDIGKWTMDSVKGDT